MTVFVFGHRNPDTDAICSAIAYADYLRRTGTPEAVAACCGAANQRTEFALKQAGLSLPRIIMDVRPELDDICNRDVVTAEEDDVCYEVYQKMHQHSVRAIPVLKDGKLTGIVTLLELMEQVFLGQVDPAESRRIQSSLSKIYGVLGAHLEHGVETDRYEELIVIVGAMSAEGFTQRLHMYPPEQMLVVAGDRPTIQLPAIERGVRAMVVTGGYELSDGLLEMAKARGVTIIYSPFDTATTTMRIKAARLIQDAVQRDFISLPDRMPVAQARQHVFRSMQPVFPVVDDDRLIGVVSKTDMANPAKAKLILVDHNELGQAVTGADEADILEVLDHHRLGGSLQTNRPIRMVMEPVGSTCTLVAQKFRRSGIDPSPAIALCMASGIISDTLFLRSPTTTEADQQALAWLQQHFDVDLEEYASQFFAIGSALRSGAANEVVREDCKLFEDQGARFSISQIEEVGFDLFWQNKDDLLAALVDMTRTEKLNFSALMVTDIATTSSLLLISHEPPGWDEINYPQLEDNLYKLDQVVSRKKQLLPLILSLLETGRS